MRRIFQDDSLQQRIDREGYVVIPFLDPEEVDDLRTVYADMSAADRPEEFYLSIWSDDVEYKQRSHERIVSVIREKAASTFDRYKHVVSNFAVKHPGQESAFGLHQGVNFTDERQFISITMWIPLQDVDARNGNMQVVPGSHRFFDQRVRSQNYPPPYEAIKDYITENHMVDLPMKAGEAWIFNHRLLHCSPINRTDQSRIATLNVMMPEEAPVLLYYKPQDRYQDGTEVEVLEFTQGNYHLQSVHGKPNVPGLVSRGLDEEVHYRVTEKEFDRMVTEYQSRSKTSVTS